MERELLLKKYIALKKARFGINMLSLCETTGYLWNSYVYLGKVPNAVATDMEMVRRMGKSDAVVPRLLDAFMRKATISKSSMWRIGTLLRNFFFLISFIRMR